MMMDRRNFIKQFGLLGLSAALEFMPLGNKLSSWAALSPNDTLHKPRLIVIFLRGAVDGLSVVVPYAENGYYQARPSIAIPHPGADNGVLDLDGHFGLNPALQSLMPLWKENSLAFVQASGSPSVNRSHFEAQDMMESGLVDTTSGSGWMNRLLTTLPGTHSDIEGVCFGETIPKSMLGPFQVATFPLGRGATNKTPIDRSEVEKVFDGFYSPNSPLSKAYNEAINSRKNLVADLTAETTAANNGAPSPNGFSSDASQLAQLIARDPRVEIAFLALGGWDTHVNQGNWQGQLANHLKPLGDGLATLRNGLGAAYNNTVIVVMSEFGRTFHENDSGGTDHGHGNVMWLMGGPVQGGKVYSQWPGLQPDQLFQNRDLAVTTDYRSVLSSVLQKHYGLNGNQLNTVFPTFSASAPQINGLIRA